MESLVRHLPETITNRRRQQRSSGETGAHGTDIIVLHGNLQHGTDCYRNAAYQCDLVLRHETPETFNNGRTAQTSWRHDDQFRTCHKGTQAGDNSPGDMKQRQRRGENVVGRVAAHCRTTENGDQLSAVGARNQFGDAGHAARMKIGRYIITATRLAEDQAIIRLRHQGGAKINHPAFGRGPGRRNANQKQTKNPVAQLQRPLPDIKLGGRAECHRNFRSGGLEQHGNAVGLQQKVDRHRIARRFRAPQRDMGLDQRRQHIGHSRRRPAHIGEHVGRTPYKPQQITVRYATRLLVGCTGHQHGDRGSITLPRNA